MRKECAILLLESMIGDPGIRVITADLGFGILDDIRNTYPDRFYNVGAAEHLMIGVAVGMANEGLRPICYSISSFLLYRPFEMLRNYVSYENIPVKLIGSGRDQDYSHDGISHWAHDDEDVLKALPNIGCFKPNSSTDLENIWDQFINSNKPEYLNLTRKI
jgi:transketolase